MIRGLWSCTLGAALLAASGPAPAQGLPAGAADCLSRLEQTSGAGNASSVRGIEDSSGDDAAAGRSPGASDSGAAHLRQRGRAQTNARLGNACPELAKTLAAGSWGASFAGKGAADLTAVELRQLIELVRHYEAAPAAGQKLAAADLRPIVAGLEPFDRPPKQSLWDRFLAKLRGWLGLDDRAANGWLANWLRRLSIPASWIRVIVYSLALLAVAGAAAVLLNELRRAGMLGRRGRRKDSEAKGFGVREGGEPAALTFEAVRRASPAKQPGLLFALIAAHLRTRFGERVRDSATHREIVRTAGSLGLVSAGPLGSVASAAESATFGGRVPPAEQLEAVLADGAAVLRELDEKRGRS
ncbi:MAG TPA: hypothetical protein VFY39_10840 [Gammaproteobacteria bacterium]|nr:hypothetical protein [Gammaproteobacteria bacterium]